MESYCASGVQTSITIRRRFLCSVDHRTDNTNVHKLEGIKFNYDEVIGLLNSTDPSSRTLAKG
jgi:hypothetical protein